VLETRIVVDPLGVEELAPGNAAFQEDRPQHPSSRVDGSAKPGRAGTYDDDVQFFAAGHAFSR
jgi:hypothetical protein